MGDIVAVLLILAIAFVPAIFTNQACTSMGRSVFADARGRTPQEKKKRSYLRFWLTVIPYVGIWPALHFPTRNSSEEIQDLVEIGIGFAALGIIYIAPGFLWGIHRAYREAILLPPPPEPSRPYYPSLDDSVLKVAKPKVEGADNAVDLGGVPDPDDRSGDGRVV